MITCRLVAPLVAAMAVGIVSAADPPSPPPDSPISPGAVVPGPPVEVPPDERRVPQRRQHPDRFATLDADGDGLISKPEASQDPKLLKLFSRIDMRPADGEISRAEFLAFTSSQHGLDY